MKKLALIITLAVFGLLTIASGPPDLGDDDIPMSPQTFISGESNALAFGASGQYACTLYASDPYKTNLDINGDGWVLCNGDFVSIRFTLALQRHRFLRWWKTLASERSPWTSDGYVSDTVFAYCENGTHTYRIVSSVEVIEDDGDKVIYRVRSDDVRFPCP